ncbi:MAG: hypothetical protein QXF45_07590 [Candidatus Caldarchaeum sp.]
MRKQEYKVYLVEYDVKAFMTLPLKDVKEAQKAGHVCMHFPSLPDTEKKLQRPVFTRV